MVGQEIVKLIPMGMSLEIARRDFSETLGDLIVLTASNGSQHVRRTVTNFEMDMAHFDVMEDKIKDMFRRLVYE